MKDSTLLVAATCCIAPTAVACTTEPAFECPDEKSLQLLDLAVNARNPGHGFKGSVAAFRFVIENSKRAMDEVALRTACFGLARDAYMEEHYDVGADVFGLIPPKGATDSLRNKHPVLANCPDDSLFETQLPIRRAAYVPPAEAVRLGITGWVRLEVDVSDDGVVDSAQIVDSSDSVLEPGVVDYVLTFRYPWRSHYGGHNMPRKGIEVTIFTDYFHVARERGCEWDDPRS